MANPVNGTLWIRFRDSNGLSRTGRGTCEGRPFTIPRHQDAKDGAYWAKLPVVREDFLDGKIELSCEVLTGPNLMIDRVVLIEDKYEKEMAGAAGSAGGYDMPRS